MDEPIYCELVECSCGRLYAIYPIAAQIRSELPAPDTEAIRHWFN